MDVEDILAKQVEQLEREKRELQEKLKSQEKKVNSLSVSFGQKISLVLICPSGHVCVMSTL